MPDRNREAPRFYGRRQGRPLKTGAKDLVETLLPRLAIPAPAAGSGVDPQSLFETKRRAFWLEVGFGGGEHLAWQAERNPDVGFIGGEVFLNGIASLLGHVARLDLSNVRVFPDDIRLLLPALPDACLGRVFVLFPDPWPKKRHAARRFVNPDNLDQMARLLADGGLLRVATDDEVCKSWTKEQMEARGEFERLDVDPVREDWPATRYEAKALREGRSPLFLEFRRRARGGESGGLSEKRLQEGTSWL